VRVNRAAAIWGSKPCRSIRRRTGIRWQSGLPIAQCAWCAALGDSYLNQAMLVKAAKAFKADAVHPARVLVGKSAVAALCANEGLTWNRSECRRDPVDGQTRRRRAVRLPTLD